MTRPLSERVDEVLDWLAIAQSEPGTAWLCQCGHQLKRAESVVKAMRKRIEVLEGKVPKPKPRKRKTDETEDVPGQTFFFPIGESNEQE